MKSYNWLSRDWDTTKTHLENFNLDIIKKTKFFSKIYELCTTTNDTVQIDTDWELNSLDYILRYWQTYYDDLKSTYMPITSRKVLTPPTITLEYADEYHATFTATTPDTSRFSDLKLVWRYNGKEYQTNLSDYFDIKLDQDKPQDVIVECKVISLSSGYQSDYSAYHLYTTVNYPQIKITPHITKLNDITYKIRLDFTYPVSFINYIEIDYANVYSLTKINDYTYEVIINNVYPHVDGFYPMYLQFVIDNIRPISTQLVIPIAGHMSDFDVYHLFTNKYPFTSDEKYIVKVIMTSLNTEEYDVLLYTVVGGHKIYFDKYNKTNSLFIVDRQFINSDMYVEIINNEGIVYTSTPMTVSDYPVGYTGITYETSYLRHDYSEFTINLGDCYNVDVDNCYLQFEKYNNIKVISKSLTKDTDGNYHLTFYLDLTNEVFQHIDNVDVYITLSKDNIIKTFKATVTVIRQVYQTYSLNKTMPYRYEVVRNTYKHLFVVRNPNTRRLYLLDYDNALSYMIDRYIDNDVLYALQLYGYYIIVLKDRFYVIKGNFVYRYDLSGNKVMQVNYSNDICMISTDTNLHIIHAGDFHKVFTIPLTDIMSFDRVYEISLTGWNTLLIRHSTHVGKYVFTLDSKNRFLRLQEVTKYNYSTGYVNKLNGDLIVLTNNNIIDTKNDILINNSYDLQHVDKYYVDKLKHYFKLSNTQYIYYTTASRLLANVTLNPDVYKFDIKHTESRTMSVLQNDIRIYSTGLVGGNGSYDDLNLNVNVVSYTTNTPDISAGEYIAMIDLFEVKFLDIENLVPGGLYYAI